MLVDAKTRCFLVMCFIINCTVLVVNINMDELRELSHVMQPDRESAF